MCRFDSTKDWNSSFLPRFRRAMTAISFTVCPENALTLTWIRWFLKHGIRIMICSDNSFSPDNLNKCENRCNERGIFFFYFKRRFSVRVEQTFWLNLFRSATYWRIKLLGFGHNNRCVIGPISAVVRIDWLGFYQIDGNFVKV